MTGTIDIRLRDASQLFRTADPFPFRENGLDPDAERYFLRRAKDAGGDLRITLHVAGDADAALGERLRAAFVSAAEEERRAMDDLFRTGRRFLLIGLAVLAACLLLAAKSEMLLGDGRAASLLHESAVVFGWVALWRPAEIFLYDWLPILLTRRALLRLARAEIAVMPG